MLYIHTHIRRKNFLVHERVWVKIIFACTESPMPLLKSKIVNQL